MNKQRKTRDFNIVIIYLSKNILWIEVQSLISYEIQK